MLVASLFAGCKVTTAPWCFHMEYGDCTSGGGTGDAPDSVRVIGFPADHVDSLGQGQLRVGESVTPNGVGRLHGVAPGSVVVVP